MGGSCYDRDVISTSSNRAFSDYSDTLINKSAVDYRLLPKEAGSRRVREIDCFHLNPIVCILDVTGSMGDWSKVIYDKLPLFFGEIEKQGYLADPAISFAAVGDANTDSAPFQICNFSQSRELDDYLSRLWLEGGGGGQHRESYELMAYYYLHHCELTRPQQSFMFFTGDEGFYPHIDPSLVRKFFGDTVNRIDAKDVFRRLKEKYHIFLLHKEYYYKDEERRILQQWREVLGEGVLILSDPKAVIDVMLGAIALTSKKRDLGTYLDDMRGRGQTPKRLKEVEEALGSYSSSLALVKVTVKGKLPTPKPAGEQSCETKKAAKEKETAEAKVEETVELKEKETAEAKEKASAEKEKKEKAGGIKDILAKAVEIVTRAKDKADESKDRNNMDTRDKDGTS